MDPKPSKPLSKEEFTSLVRVGDCALQTTAPAAIPAEHKRRLAELGYLMKLLGRLRVTTIGRRRIEVGFEIPSSANRERLIRAVPLDP